MSTKVILKDKDGNNLLIGQEQIEGLEEALANAGGSAGGSSAIELTYAELVELKNNSQLIAGTNYIITDFVTTTIEGGTTSAEHQFDVIVVADSENTLNENARARKHKGDTYFADCNLAAWELKYSLENEIAPVTVIVSRMGKDTVYNLVSIDGDTSVWAYDGSGHSGPTPSASLSYTGTVDNPYPTVGASFDMGTVKSVNEGGSTRTGVITWLKDEFNNECPYDFKNIKFLGSKLTSVKGVVELEQEKYYYTFNYTHMGENYDTSTVKTRGVYKNVIKAKGKKYTFNVFLGDVIRNNTLDLGCEYNTFSSSCYNNTLGNGCSFNIFGNGCYENILSANCGNNTFIKVCYDNTFGTGCHNNTLDENCINNTFGNKCFYNTFGNVCSSNTLGNGCSNNTLGANCNKNNFETECQNNKLVESCSFNTFGNNCNQNTFGTGCQNNTLGNDNIKNTLGNGCSFNTFGNNCNGNTIPSTCMYVKLDNTVSYIKLNDTATVMDNLKYVHIHSGVMGTDIDNIKVIDIDNRNTFSNTDIKATDRKTVEV